MLFRSDNDQFSRAHLRRLRADVLLDAIAQVTATPSTFGQTPAGLRAVQLDEGNRIANNYFLKTFGLCSRESVSASETRMEPTLAQALHLINGDTVEGKLNRSTVVSGMIAAKKSPGEILDELFVRAVARKPSETEKKKLMPLVVGNDKKAYDDVLWALLNSTEFEFNH